MEGYDTSGEAQSIARRRKMLEAMMAQSRQPLVGRSGPTQALAQMLTGVLLDRQHGQVDQQDADGRAKYGAELGAETGQFLERMTGKPGQQMSPEQVDALMTRDQAPQLADPVAANPREALIRAMTSQKPEMRALGKAGMAERVKGPAAEKFNETPRTFKNASGALITALIGDQGTVRELPGYNPPPKFAATSGGHIWNESEGTGTGTYVGPKFGPDEVVGGATVQRNLASGEANTVASPPPQVRVETNVDNVGAGAAVREVLPVLKSATESMNQSYKNIQTAERMYQLASDPAIITGFAASPVKGLASLASKLGFMGAEGVNKTDALITDLASTTLGRSQEMKGALSNADILFLQDVVAGKIEKNAEVLRHVSGLSLAANHNALLQADNQYNSATTVKGAGESGKLYPKPKFRYSIPDNKEFSVDDGHQMRYNSPLYESKKPAGAAAPGATMSLEEYLKRK